MSKLIKEHCWCIYNPRMKEVFVSSIRPTRDQVWKAIGCTSLKQFKEINTRPHGYRLVRIKLEYETDTPTKA